MTKFSAANERVKHRYLHYLKDVKGRDDASIDGAAKAIHRFKSIPNIGISRNFTSNRRAGSRRTLAQPAMSEPASPCRPRPFIRRLRR